MAHGREGPAGEIHSLHDNDARHKRHVHCMASVEKDNGGQRMPWCNGDLVKNNYDVKVLRQEASQQSSSGGEVMEYFPQL
jgi:hypothetical protein